MTNGEWLEDDPHWGPHAARFNLSVAKEAFARLENVSFDDPAPWYLYFSSTLLFARAAIDALREGDGKRNRLIAEEWKTLFHAEVKTHSIFLEVLDGERDLLSHGKIGIAIHPHWPIDTVERHGGLEAIFLDGPPTWPDGTFKGNTVDVMLEKALRQVGAWIDTVGVRAQQRAGPYVPAEAVLED